jgi:hypothetical protein
MDEAVKTNALQAIKLSTSASKNALLSKVIKALNETEGKTRKQWYSIHYDLLRKIGDLVRRRRSARKIWQVERMNLRRQSARIIRQLNDLLEALTKSFEIVGRSKILNQAGRGECWSLESLYYMAIKHVHVNARDIYAIGRKKDRE